MSKNSIFIILSLLLLFILFYKSFWLSIVGVVILGIMNYLYFRKPKDYPLLNKDFIYDPTTNLVSAIYFRHHLTEDFQKAKRNNKPLSILVFDIDHFKEINLNLGFRFGDLLLYEIAQIVTSCLRTSDVLSYFGGDEFGVILADIDKENAVKVGERIRNRLTSSPLTISVDGREEKIHFTISMGGATLTPEMETPLDLLERARLNLEKARRQGGNNFIFE